MTSLVYNSNLGMITAMPQMSNVILSAPVRAIVNDLLAGIDSLTEAGTVSQQRRITLRDAVLGSYFILAKVTK